MKLPRNSKSIYGNPFYPKLPPELSYTFISIKCECTGDGKRISVFLYSTTNKKTSRDEQITAYKKVIDAVFTNPVTIRTIDVGGDKRIDYLNMKNDENPFLRNHGRVRKLRR